MASTEDSAADLYAKVTDAICEIARRHTDAGRLSDALRVLGIAEQLTSESEAPLGERVDVLLQKGRVLIYHGSFVTNEFDAAFTALEKAREIAFDKADRLVLAEILDAIGLAYYHRALLGDGNFDAAEGLFNQALALQSEEDEQRYSLALFHTGLIAERQRRYDEAVATFERVRELTERHGFVRERAEALRHLGFARLRADDVAGALRYLQDSLTLLVQTGYSLVVPFARLAVADVQQMQGQTDDALQGYQIASAEADALGLRRGQLQIAFSMGEWYQAHGEQATASSWYERAGKLAEAMKYTQAVAMCREALSRLDA